jgi:hypothetical protein
MGGEKFHRGKLPGLAGVFSANFSLHDLAKRIGEEELNSYGNSTAGACHMGKQSKDFGDAFD